MTATKIFAKRKNAICDQCGVGYGGKPIVDHFMGPTHVGAVGARVKLSELKVFSSCTPISY